ncbi:hypothetical protein HON22_04720, partial [Candidatus Peregrinibacteria bacterium]|nr:hypothetical protein [Candidatus Peregrinibacteria bacterium]
TVNETTLREVYTEVIMESNPELCAEKLNSELDINNCKDNYWNIQASATLDASLCKSIINEASQTNCIASLTDWGNEDLSGLSDEEIQAKSEECLAQPIEANQNVCWNSLFLGVAIGNADPEKCMSIKDEETQSTCLVKSELALDEEYKQKAINEGNVSTCEKILDTAIKSSCTSKAFEASLRVSDTCDQSCTDKKIEQAAVTKLDSAYCDRSSEDARENCYDFYYAELAYTQQDSRICEKVSDSTIKSTCEADVSSEKDKNPEVQLEQFRKTERSFPKVGEELINPLDETFSEESNISDINDFFDSESTVDENNLESVLAELERIEAGEDISSTEESTPSTQTSACGAFRTDSLKMACEDSLVLQEALTKKSLNMCSYIQDTETQEYCELEIIEEDARKAAESARSQCMLLSSDSAQQKCLKNLGFFTDEVELDSAVDCLDYADPLERISCMREMK